MPASKRSSESHSPKAKMMKLDEDEEATPGANNSSHKTEDAHERTVPPWTKKKDLPTAKEEDEEVASILHQSKRSPRQNDSDPPLKKAKLFIATSASSGTASPQSTESKASQKRPASTELSRTASSESAGELSDDDRKASLFTRTDAGDVSRCAAKYPNRAKHAATESLVDQTITSQTLDDGTPLYPAEMDHNYGRASEGSSDSSVVDEAANTETKEVNVSSATGAETTACINSASLPSLQATPDSVIQSTHPAAEARRHEGEEPTRSTTEAGSSAEHVNNKDVETSRETFDLVRPNEKHEEHETEDPSERTSREPDSQNHIDGKTVEPPPPAETSDPSSSDRNLSLTAEVNLSASQERSEVFSITGHLTGPEPREEETQDPGPEELEPDIMPKREAEELTQQPGTEATGITEAPRKAALESSPASNQTTTTNCYQVQVLAGPSEGSVTPAETRGPPEREDEALVKTLLTLEKMPTAEPVLPDLVAPSGEETLANGSGVNPVAESLGSQSAVQADLGEGNRVVSVAEESIAAPESSAEVQQVHDIQELDDSTVSSSTEVVVTNSEEHVGRTVYEFVTVQEPEITSNLDSTTISQGMCDTVPAENTQPEVMQNVDTSTGTSSDVSAQVTVTNPDSRQTEYEYVSERITVQETQSTPNLVSTTTDPVPAEKTEPDGTQHLDVTPGTSSDGPEHLPDTESEVVSECVTEEEVQPEVNLSSSTAVLEEKPDLVDTEATMEEEVSQKIDEDSAVSGLSSHGWDHMVVRPLISEEQDNVNVESTATLEVSSTMPTDGILHYREASSANGENNEVVSECVAETSVNMDSTATDEQIPGGGRHRETHSADVDSSVDIDAKVPQHVMMNAGSKEGETVISEYVPVQKTDMKVATSEEMSLPAPTEDLEDKKIQRVYNDCTGMSSEAPKHQTHSTSDMVTSVCVGDQDIAPYMETTETKPGLSNRAQENESLDQKDHCMEQSMVMSEDGASQLMSKNVDPKEKYEIVSQSIPVQTPQVDAAMSMTVSLQQASSPVPNKEIQTQKDHMAMDKHILIANSQTSQNQDKISECHAGHGGQTDLIAESFITEVMGEDGQQKVNNGTNLSAEVSTHPSIIISESAINEDVITSECAAVPEAEPDENMQTTSTPEEMHEPGTKEHGGDQGNHSVNEHAPTEDEEKDEDRFDKIEAGLHTADGLSNSVPAAEQQIQVIHEEPKGPLISNAELMDKETTMEAVAYMTSGDQRDEDEVTSMEEKAHSVLEEKQEGPGQLIDEVEVDASLSSTTGQCEAQVNSEVIVFVCGQQEGDVVDESSTVNNPDGEDVTEQMKTVIQSEGEAKDFQVVYEAISSPESTIDEEISVVPEVPVSIVLPNTQREETQEVEGDSAVISTTSEVNVPISPAQEADEQINGKTPACLPDSQSNVYIEAMICEVTAESSDALPIEHINGAVDMGDVLVVATSDKVPEPNIQKTGAMADVLEETTSGHIPEQNFQNTGAMADVLEETTSDHIPDHTPEQNIQNTGGMADVLEETTSDHIPEQNIQNTEEMGEVPMVTTSNEVPEPSFQKTEEMGELLVVATSDHIPEQNIQNTEEMGEVPMVTTSNKVPEPSFQNTEDMGELLVVATSDHIPEQNIQNTEEMGEVPMVTTSNKVPEPSFQNTEEMGEVPMVTTRNKVPEQNIQNTEEMAEVLVVTASEEIPEPNIQKMEEIVDVLVETTSNHIPEPSIQKTEEMAEVLVVTASEEIPEPNIQKMEEIVDVLVETTSNHIPEPSIQKTEEMAEVLVVTTSEEIPEPNIQKTEESVDVLVETTSNHIPEPSIQKTEAMAEVLVVATSEEIPEPNIQKTEGMGDVLVVTTCDNMPEPTMQQTAEVRVVTTTEEIPEPNIQKTERMGDVLVVTTCDNMPEPTMQQTEGMGDEKEEAIEEANRAPESVEMQKDNRLQELSQETPISTAMVSSETPDSLCQEEVMESLTVPESADHTDIITQAAAASGLTTSLSEHLNSDSQMVEADQVLNLNRTSQSFYSAIGVQQYQGMDQSTVTSSNEESREDLEFKSATDAAPVALLEKDIPSVPKADQQEEQSAEKNHDATEHEMENPTVCEPQTPAYENASVEMNESVEASLENAEGDMQILVDIELGHQVEVQDESEMDDPDVVIIEKSHSAVEIPPVEGGKNGGEKSPTSNADNTTSNADRTTSNADNTTSNADSTTSNADHTTSNADSTTSNTNSSNQKAEETINKTSKPSVTPDPKAEVTVEKPRKQQMNTQARTKARLAALAEQKAAASKRAAQRQQLNLLALCEEIAEDIATDSMLLKRIEEEKLAAATKMEAMKKKSTPVDKQEATSVPPTPAGPQASSPPLNTADEASSAQPTTTTTTAEPAEAKPVAPEPPKRRFFVSQIVVPLKAHEKKKLTRYQRLRQVELQREKMSWTRVKKLKTDQAHQMLFSDIDFDSSNPFLMPPVATPLTPVANKPISADANTASTSTSTPSTLPATPEVPDAAATKPDQSKAVVTTPDPSKAVTIPDPSKAVTTPDPSKELATTDPSKAVPTKPDQKETLTPRPGRPRREAATPKVDPAKVVRSKVEPQKTGPSKVTLAQGPTPKVTRSSTRKTLPAKPPPMPNGMNTQKAKSEMEYKPYRPRPKYSIEDFELDDDPPPVVQRRPMPQPRPGQQAGPSQQSTSTSQVRPTLQSTNPTAQSRTTPPSPSKPMVSSQLAGQTKPKLQSTPARQISGQSKPATSTPVQSKPTTSTPVQSKSATSNPVQSRPATSTPVQSKPLTSMAPHPKPVAPNISQSKPSIAAALQPKTTVATTAQPVSAVPSEPTQKNQNQVSDTVCSVPGKAMPSGSPAPQIRTAGPTTPQPQPGSLKEEEEVKPAVETPVSIPADPHPDVSMETLGVQPPATPNIKCQDSTNEVPPPPPTSSSLPSEEQQTSSDRTELTEEKPEVKSPPSPMKASPPKEQAETAKPAEKTPAQPSEHRVGKAESNTTPLSETSLQKEVKKLKEADKDGTQTIIDAGQKHFGAVACSVCGMLYSAANPEDETQHLLFHNQFISAVKYVGWKKERILGEYPDGKIILVLPDDPKYALKKVEEIREMVDNDLGFQQVETKCPSQTKTFLFISNDKKVAGCLIAEHIQEGYRVIEDPAPEGSERERLMFERQRAWCCSSTSEPAICGISRIWVFSMMRRQGIASRMIECLRNNFIYGSCLGKDELAFSDPTPDGKLFATQYFGTSRFLVYNFVSGTRPSEPETTTA